MVNLSKIISTSLSVLLISLTFGIKGYEVNAHYHPGYSHESIIFTEEGINNAALGSLGGLNSDFNNSIKTESEYYKSWMSNLPDDKQVNYISIPGTHNSMSSGNYTDFSLNQSTSLETQLNSGIRFLDIRVQNNGNLDLPIHHGIVYLGTDFLDVIERTTRFLDENPSEFIFMRIKEENTSTDDFHKAIKDTIVKNGYDNYIFNSRHYLAPTLGEVRGKIIILADYSNDEWKTNHYRLAANIQDEYHLSTNWDLYDKWIAVKQQLIDANNHSLSGIGTVTKYINYLSGSGGVLPYFVASGHSSSGTSAARLSTGLTEPGFHNYYPDFPRVDWFGDFATIAFEGTNVLTTNFLNSGEINFAGIVVSDFPGPGLIKSIVGLNF